VRGDRGGGRSEKGRTHHARLGPLPRSFSSLGQLDLPEPRLALAVTALLAASCSCPGTNVVVDDFEGCTGTCGWSILGTGSATVVSTILPAEHGLRLDDVAAAGKALADVTIDDTYSIQLVADCPAGLAATLSGSASGVPAFIVTVPLMIDNTLDSNGDVPDYSGATYVPLLGPIALPNGVTSAVVNQLTLLPTPGVPCTIDVVRLTSTPPCSD
jgi:hypothetical protein